MMMFIQVFLMTYLLFYTVWINKTKKAGEGQKIDKNKKCGGRGVIWGLRLCLLSQSAFYCRHLQLNVDICQKDCANESIEQHGWVEIVLLVFGAWHSNCTTGVLKKQVYTNKLIWELQSWWKPFLLKTFASGICSHNW